MIRWAQKALSSMRHSGMQRLSLWSRLKRTRFDYAKEVGSGIDASVVMAPIQWIQRAYPEGRVRVQRNVKGNLQEVDNHPLVQLMAMPNPAYSDEALIAGVLLSYCTDGNAYMIKVRNANRVVKELWYAPHWLMKEVWPEDGSEFISGYDYTYDSGKKPWRLAVDDVVHIRHGIDPRNPRRGLSPLHSVLREIFTDMEASNFVASLLRNMAVPGVVISPEGGVQAAPDDADAVKKWWRQAFGGDNRGDALVMTGPTKVQEFGFNPQQMDLSVTRDVAEERVCAVLGIPAAVVGFGAGLQTAKVGATMSELRTLAWTNGILPIMRVVAGELKRALPEMVKPEEMVDYDTSMVLALAEYRLAQATAWNTMVQGGWSMVYEARDAMGLDVDDSHRIYLRSFNVIEVPAGAPPRALPALPADDPEEPDEDDDPGEPKSMDLRGLLPKHRALVEQLIAAGRKNRHRPSTGQRRYVEALQRMERPLSELFEGRLKSFFEKLGKAAAAAARPILEEDELGQADAGDRGETKNDEVLAGRIIEQLELPLHQTTFQRLYEAQFLEVAKEVAKAGELVGLATDLPDPVARAVVAAGGRRSGLVDMSRQSRQALFDALAEGRAAGEGVAQLTDRIAEQVGGGPWRSTENRARTIARTETKYAQNVSTLARARHEGVERFIVFDGRLGPDRSDPEHIARDGSIVTSQEADQMAAEEHPNGTLSFAPHFETEE